MRVNVGQISAHCLRCGCEEFQPTLGEPSASELSCFSCGLSTTRRALLTQVAEETVRRAEAFLETSRRLRNRPTR